MEPDRHEPGAAPSGRAGTALRSAQPSAGPPPRRTQRRGPDAGGTSVVAIGASAGGLDAASKLFDATPADSGLAFILVQHLDPNNGSLLVDLLAGHTAMPVVEAVDGCVLAANHVYIIPPGRYLSVRAGALRLSDPPEYHSVRLPFDHLLNSLAEACGERTLCVILSGNGGDGSLGIVPLKASGGFIIAQQPDEADFKDMPRNAIETGLVDAVMPLADIPNMLAAFAERSAHHAVRNAPASAAGSPPGLAEIIDLLRDETGGDFRQYKPGTLERRIVRRMGLIGIKPHALAQYHALLRGDKAERDLLAKDLLINVTSFFRDAKMFETLDRTTIPGIVTHLPDDQPLRVWVAGCSTGEEAYSLGMICLDAIADSGRRIKLQIFASDADTGAITSARAGLYPFDIARTMSPGRLARYFARESVGYRVAPALRSAVVFSVQDVLSDPPFSRLDLVSCRNVLIYLNLEAQAKVILQFHFALREGGILLLGPSEGIGNAGDRFEVIADAERLYRRIGKSRIAEAAVAVNSLPTLPQRTSPTARSTFADICHRAILTNHAPAAVLIDRNRRCLYLSGPTDRYLRVAPGNATHDILAMARSSLRTKLRQAIERAGKAEPRVSGGRSRLIDDGRTIWFRINVEWLFADGQDLLLICFVEEPSPALRHAAAPPSGDDARIADLEHELDATRTELQISVQNQELALLEQKATDQEALSVNEEFQSTNEELLTSKEELQSLNEELTSLNSQLKETLERQRLTSDDLQNILYSTKVATLFLDAQLRIRFFTPAIKALFNVIPGDVGRPLADLNSIASDPHLSQDARQALADEAPIEREISGRDGSWFVRRIFPYRAHDNRVEGVVITFADITDSKTGGMALEAAKLDAERANLSKSRFLAAASHDLRQPLQSLMLLQGLLAQTVDGERPQELIARLKHTLDAMSGMLNTLLDINQIEAGVVEARPEIFPISRTLDRMRDEFASMAVAQGLSLRVLPCSAIVESDPLLLEQMIRNLIGNALKYTKSGKILFGCRRRGDLLRVEVWDTGIGIAPGDLHAVFDEFHQVGNGARQRSQGLGLGLAIVQRIGALLGHEVDVRSVLGKGSMFAIAVRRAAALPAAIAKPVSLPRGRDAGVHRSAEIVIVDDDPDVLGLLEHCLMANGHSVTTAADGAAALALFTAGAVHPEILLTDYNLPNGMTGIQLLAAVREKLHHRLPAIILTGDITREALAIIAMEDCIRLSKPVAPDELIAAIERLSTRNHPVASAAMQPVTHPSMIYVIDDDDDVRASIRDVLELDGRTVEDYATAEMFLEAYRPGLECCLLVDAYLPGMGGVRLLRELRARGDQIPAIMITGSGDVGLAVEAMRTGASDFIEKPVTSGELLDSIVRALDQSKDLHLVSAGQEIAARHVAGLTPRQRQVMDLVLAGNPSKNVAADLGISQRTVENHRASVMRKMAVKSLPELARQALLAEGKDH